MTIKVGSIVKLYEDKKLWKVIALRGEDVPGQSFAEYELREPDGYWRMAIVRKERIEEVLS